MGQVKVKEVTCKNIMNRSRIEGVDYAINPYLGCVHGCIYCYARYMTRFHIGKEGWGGFVDIKINALERLEKEVPRSQYGRVLLSSVTDPYQPIETKYQLTRGCLKILQREGLPVDILTKSDLVLRDIDILTEMECEVGFTIISMDNKIRECFEPRASTIQSRLDALKTLHENDIHTYAFLGPLLPYLSEKTLELLLDSLVDRVDRIIVDRLNIKAGNWRPIIDVIRECYPNIEPSLKSALTESSRYYNDLKRKIESLCEERYIPLDIQF